MNSHINRMFNSWTIIIICVFTAFIPLYTLILNSALGITDQYNRFMEKYYTTLTEKACFEFSRVIYRGGYSLELFSENPVIRDPLSSPSGVRDEIIRFQKRCPVLQNLYCLDPRGDLQAALSGSLPEAWRGKEWFREGLNGIPGVYNTEDSGQNIHLVVTQPVLNDNNEVKRVFIGVLGNESIRAISERYRNDFDVYLLLIQNDGYLFISGPDEELPLPGSHRDLLLDRSEQEPKISTFIKDGKKYYAISSVILFRNRNQDPLTLSLIMPEKVYYGVLYRNRLLFVIFLPLSVIPLVLLQLFANRKLKKRLDNIGLAIESLASGECCECITDKGDDKIADLLNKVHQAYKLLESARNERREALNSLTEANQYLSESNQRFQLAVEGANDAIWDWDIVKDELYISRRWSSLLGIDGNFEAAGIEDWYNCIIPEDRARVRQVLQDHLNGETPLFNVEYRIMNKKTGMRWILSRGLASENDDSRDIRMSGSHSDITVGRQLQEKLHFNAFHDDLTHLPNRMKLKDRIDESILRKQRDGDYQFALLYLDFDGFKHINDSFGHGVGDQLLISIAERLTHCVRPLDLISRFGGDEFVILLDGVGGRVNVQTILERMMAEMKRPFEVDGHSLFISVSIGVAGLEEDHNSPDDVIQKADIAMYRAKNEGKAQFVYYESSMGSVEKRRWFLENEMHKALGTHCMQVHYQPVVSSDAGVIYGMEALIRWNHLDQGYVSPAEFIPIAEETGFINQITRWLLYQVCQQAVLLNYKNEYQDSIRIAMNVSSRDFLTAEGLDAIIHNGLKDTGCRPEWIAVEVTEGTLIKDFDIVSRQLKQIAEMGILIELDDFGTGYSSLSYLNRFPLAILKIDRSFIITMEESESSRKLVQTIIHMAKDLGMRTIAEGVELESQRKLLEEMGCDYIQGYLIAKPLSDLDVSGFLSSWFLEQSNQSRNIQFG